MVIAWPSRIKADKTAAHPGSVVCPGSGGKVTLWANDKQIGEGRLDKTVPIGFTSYAGMDIGRDNGGVVDLTYEEKAPYAFTGTVKKVVFDLKPDQTRCTGPQPVHALHERRPDSVLELVGIPEPKVVNGIEQEPMDGTSFAYTLEDPRAAERHTVQYFEMYGSRAIYKDGWWACAQLDKLPWDFSPATLARFKPGSGYDPDQDPWELYYLPNNF